VTYYFLTVIVAMIILAGVAVYFFLFPPDHFDSGNIDLGNFTVNYAMKDIDDGGIGIVRDSDRLQLQMVIQNKYPDNINLFYSDSISQSGPPQLISQEPFMLIHKGDKKELTRTFLLHAGVNVVYPTFDLSTYVNPYEGGHPVSPAEIQKVTLNLPTVRAITQSEYDGRFVLVTTVLLASATIVLVCITGYYAKQTKNTVEVLRKTAELSVRPYLKGTFQPIGPVAGDLLIKNVGNGPAHKIELSYWIESKDETRRNWTKPLLMPNDGDEFFIPKNEKENVFDNTFFENNQTTIRIEGKYFDILGNEYKIDDHVDVTSYVKQWKKTSMRYKEPPIEEISKSIEKISSSIDDLGREITKIGYRLEKKDNQNKD
jgi:hypothetical protein